MSTAQTKRVPWIRIVLPETLYTETIRAQCERCRADVEIEIESIEAMVVLVKEFEGAHVLCSARKLPAVA